MGAFSVSNQSGLSRLSSQAEIGSLRARIAELELAQDYAKDIFSLIHMYAEDAIVVLQDDEVVYANEAILKLVAIKPGQGLCWSKFIVSAEREFVNEHSRQRLNGGDAPAAYPVTLLAPDDGKVRARVEPRAVEFRGKPAILCLLRDVTEQEATELELQQISSQLSEAQAFAQLETWAWDEETNIFHSSDQRFPSEPPETHTPAQFIEFSKHILPKDKRRVMDLFETAMADCGTYNLEYQIWRPNGDVRDIHNWGRAERNPDTGKLRMYGADQDITNIRSRKKNSASIKAGSS